MDAFESDPRAVYIFTGTFFHALRAAGVEHVVVSPGSRSTPLAITARHTPGLRTWIELDERAAAFFALGLAKASGRPALLVCTSGTAAANYLPAIVEAHHARVPMVVATSDRPPELRDWGAGQTIDQLGLYGRHVRWAVDLPVPTAGEDAQRYAAQLAARAVEEATGRPAGAVHLNWPLREPLAPPPAALPALLAEAARGPIGPTFRAAHRFAASEEIEALVELARTRERGLVCVGPLDSDPLLEGAIAAFAAAAGWPVLADPASNLRAGRGPGLGPILDVGDVLARATGFVERHQPDVVVRIGDPPVSKAQRLWIESSTPEEVLWLDEGGQWGEPSRLATRVLRGGAVSLLKGAAVDLAAAQGEAGLRERPWCRSFEAAGARARKTLDDEASGSGDLDGLAVAAAVARAVPSDAQLFASNSMSIRLLDLTLACRAEPMRVFCSRGASGIDGVTSTALGVAAATGKPTLLLTGDLALLHDLSGLLLARREEIPLTVVVLDDDGGGIFSMLPVASQGEAVGFHELFHTPHGVDLSRVAPLFGLDAHTARDPEALERSLRAALAVSGVSIIHVPIDAKANVARFQAAIGAACDAVDAGLAA